MKIDPPGPTTPRVVDLIEAEFHLVISCGRCRRVVRLTPIEAVEALGSGPIKALAA